MAGKRLFLFAAIFMLGFPMVFAQTPDAAADVEAALAAQEGQGFFIDRSGAEPRFIQRLVWDQNPYALRYEVIVQQMGPGGVFRDVERVSVETAFADVSLLAGTYRFRLRIYDLLNEYAFTTDWREFEVVRALQPTITSFSPSAFWLDEDLVFEITLRGQNLLPESAIFLVQGSSRIVPRTHISDGTTSRLIFSGASLSPGEYDVYVRNPGGLDTQVGTFRIANRKPFDINISVGFAPVIPLYGYLFRDAALDAPFNNSIYPLGAVVRLGFLPVKRVWGNIGIEFAGAAAIFGQDRDFYTTNAYFLNAQLGFLYQRYFRGRTVAINASLGGGISAVTNFYYEYLVGPSTEKEMFIYPSAYAGLSFMFFFRRPYYIQAGADFVHMFSPDTPTPGFLLPFITIGIRL